MSTRLASLAILLSLVASAQLSAAEPTTLEAHDGLRWYKGNMHTHSLWSDGDDFPEMIALWYRDHDYNFLVFTDHNVLHTFEKWATIGKRPPQEGYDKLKARFPKDWIIERTEDGKHQVQLKHFTDVSKVLNQPGKFLLIQGEEISDRFEKYPVHLNASNIQEAVPPIGGGSVREVIQNNVNAVIAQRERTGKPMLVHLNHPNFGYAVTAEDLMHIVGEKFFEVYNGHPGVHNTGDHHHASTETIWDVVLTHRIAELGLPIMYGLATDDGHNYHNIPSRKSEPGRGWVQVLASDLSAKSIIEALEVGRFYASSGVTLKRVQTSDSSYVVEVEAEEGVDYRIDFIGTRKGYDASSEVVTDKDDKEVRTTRRYSDDVGKVLATVEGAHASYKLTGDEIYVRARVTSSKQHPNPSEEDDFEQAWCQPMLGPAAPGK